MFSNLNDSVISGSRPRSANLTLSLSPRFQYPLSASEGDTQIKLRLEAKPCHKPPSLGSLRGAELQLAVGPGALSQAGHGLRSLSAVQQRGCAWESHAAAQRWGWAVLWAVGSGHRARPPTMGPLSVKR